jgi:hypothetical protein
LDDAGIHGVHAGEDVNSRSAALKKKEFLETEEPEINQEMKR